MYAFLIFHGLRSSNEIVKGHSEQDNAQKMTLYFGHSKLNQTLKRDCDFCRNAPDVAKAATKAESDSESDSQPQSDCASQSRSEAESESESLAGSR